jgi:hypothetical protein
MMSGRSNLWAQGYPTEMPTLSLVDPLLLSSTQVHTLTKLVQDFAKQKKGTAMLFDVSPRYGSGCGIG